MKRILLFLLSVFVVTTWAQGNKSIGKVTFPIGKNYVQIPGHLNWKNVRYNMPIYDKDKIKTAKQSRCEVTFQTKKVMRIGENSIVEITRDKAGTDEVKMSKGLAWLSLFLPKGTSHLRVRTPSSVCAIRGTVYRLNCDSTQTTYRCYQGTIAVTPFKKDGKTLQDSTFHIGAGEELILIMNFDEYKKQQEKAFKNFKQEDRQNFEEFMKKDQQEFNNMVQQDLKDFKEMNNVGFKHSSFDQEKDAQSDWVQWNKERDQAIKQGE